MDKETPSLAAESEAIREAYAALNRNDIAAMVEAFDPQIEWIAPADQSTDRTAPSRNTVLAPTSPRSMSRRGTTAASNAAGAPTTPREREPSSSRSMLYRSPSPASRSYVEAPCPMSEKLALGLTGASKSPRISVSLWPLVSASDSST